MHKGLVCDVKRYLTPLAPELQSNTFNYQWLCLVVDIKMSASRSVTSGSLPLVMSRAVHSFPSTHIRTAMGKHLSWCVSETSPVLILKRKTPNTAWTWLMIFSFENFDRLVESGSLLLARREMGHNVYTFKGLSVIHLIQMHILMWGASIS